eukprot:10489361-Ditylum_brightwellii.AAC.1
MGGLESGPGTQHCTNTAITSSKQNQLTADNVGGEGSSNAKEQKLPLALMKRIHGQKERMAETM